MIKLLSLREHSPGRERGRSVSTCQGGLPRGSLGERLGRGKLGRSARPGQLGRLSLGSAGELTLLTFRTASRCKEAERVKSSRAALWKL